MSVQKQGRVCNTRPFYNNALIRTTNPFVPKYEYSKSISNHQKQTQTSLLKNKQQQIQIKAHKKREEGSWS